MKLAYNFCLLNVIILTCLFIGTFSIKGKASIFDEGVVYIEDTNIFYLDASEVLRFPSDRKKTVFHPVK